MAFETRQVSCRLFFFILSFLQILLKFYYRSFSYIFTHFYMAFVKKKLFSHLPGGGVELSNRSLGRLSVVFTILASVSNSARFWIEISDVVF